MRELDGVRYVNDSKATNTAAARRGVAAYDAPLRLILGGSLKGEDFAPLARELPANVRSIYLIGEATEQLAAALDAAGRAYARDGDLAHAVAHAQADAQPGDIVLLSPAAASFDQFRDFEERGDAFRAARARARMAARKRHSLEWQLLVFVPIAMTAFGLVMVYSATSASAALGNGNPVGYLERQSIYALAGIALMIAASRTDFRKLRPLAPPLIITALGLCAAVLVHRRAHQRRAPLDRLRPCGVPAVRAREARARHLVRRVPRAQAAAADAQGLARPVGMLVGLFCLLILARARPRHRDHDRRRWSARCCSSPAHRCRRSRPHTASSSRSRRSPRSASPYRRARLLVFLDPWKDPTGNGLQNVQALISVGSGGVFGRGLGEGIHKIHYLPEAHTDMIFAVIGEELGLVGAAILIAGYAAFAYAGLRLAIGCKDPFGKRLAAGVDGAHLRAGRDQPRRRARARAADRNSAAVRLLRRLEPRHRAPVGRHPP